MSNLRTLLLAGVFVASLAWGGTATAALLPYQDAVLLEPSVFHYWTFEELNGGGKVTDLRNPANAAAELEPFFGAGLSAGGSTTGGLTLGNAATLDGVDDIFRTGVMGGSNPISAHVLEYWIRDADNAAPAYRQSYTFNFASNTIGNSGQNTPGILYDFDDGAGADGRNTVEVFAPGTRSDGGPVIADNAWHHVVLAYYGDGASNGAQDPGGVTVNRQEAYLDGVQVPGYTVGRYFPRFAQVMFLGGADMQGAGGTTRNPFHGQLDETALYQFPNGVPVAEVEAAVARIAGHYSAAGVEAPGATAYTWQVLKDNPRFYWSFNEAENRGNALELVRGQVNDQLAPQGDAHRAFGATANLGFATRQDGNGAWAAPAPDDYEMTGAWAIELWAKADTTGVIFPGGSSSRGDYLVHAQTNHTAVIYDFGVGGDNKLELFSGLSGRTEGAGPSIDDSDWHHFVLTFFGNSEARFGVADRIMMTEDGAVVYDGPRGAFSSGFRLSTPLWIGGADANGPGGAIRNSFEGQIDEVAFYDLSGLTESEVAARTLRIAGHYQSASGPAATPLYYVAGPTYSIDPATPPGGGTYADPSQTKLTDGVIGSTGSAAAGFASDQWVGWQNVDPVLTFDLQQTEALDSLFVDYTVGHRWGIYAPDSVLIEFSADGTDFSSIPSIVSTELNDFDWWDDPTDPRKPEISWARRAIFDLEDTPARYVRLTFANDQEWTFLGEVQFVAHAAAIPEPSTLALLAVGALGLVFWRRRRKR